MNARIRKKRLSYWPKRPKGPCVPLFGFAIIRRAGMELLKSPMRLMCTRHGPILERGATYAEHRLLYPRSDCRVASMAMATLAEGRITPITPPAPRDPELRGWSSEAP